MFAVTSNLSYNKYEIKSEIRPTIDCKDFRLNIAIRLKSCSSAKCWSNVRESKDNIFNFMEINHIGWQADCLYIKYSVFKKEGVKVEGYYTAKKWILGAV